VSLVSLMNLVSLVSPLNLASSVSHVSSLNSASPVSSVNLVNSVSLLFSESGEFSEFFGEFASLFHVILRGVGLNKLYLILFSARKDVLYRCNQSFQYLHQH